MMQNMNLQMHHYVWFLQIGSDIKYLEISYVATIYIRNSMIRFTTHLLLSDALNCAKSLGKDFLKSIKTIKITSSIT